MPKASTSLVHTDVRTVAKVEPGKTGTTTVHYTDGTKDAGLASQQTSDIIRGKRRDGGEYGSGYSGSDPRADPAYDRYTDDLNARLEKAKDEHGDTQALFTQTNARGVTGYTPERLAVHDAIIRDLLASYAGVPKERKAIVLAGPPAAGKSTVIKIHGQQFGVESTVDAKGNVTPTNYATVNPDDLKAALTRYAGVPEDYRAAGLGPNETAALLHNESSDLSKRLQSALTIRGHNLIIDGTFAGSTEKQLAKVDRLRADGYTVSGVLVDGDVEQSLAQAGQRHLADRLPTQLDSGGPLQGRYVPLNLIEGQRNTAGAQSATFGRAHRSEAAINFEAGQSRFDGGALIFDRTSGETTVTHRAAGSLIKGAAPETKTAARVVDVPRSVVLAAYAGLAETSPASAVHTMWARILTRDARVPESLVRRVARAESKTIGGPVTHRWAAALVEAWDRPSGSSRVIAAVADRVLQRKTLPSGVTSARLVAMVEQKAFNASEPKGRVVTSGAGGGKAKRRVATLMLQHLTPEEQRASVAGTHKLAVSRGILSIPASHQGDSSVVTHRGVKHDLGTTEGRKAFTKAKLAEVNGDAAPKARAAAPRRAPAAGAMLLPGGGTVRVGGLVRVGGFSFNTATADGRASLADYAARRRRGTKALPGAEVKDVMATGVSVPSLGTTDATVIVPPAGLTPVSALVTCAACRARVPRRADGTPRAHRAPWTVGTCPGVGRVPSAGRLLQSKTAAPTVGKRRSQDLRRSSTASTPRPPTPRRGHAGSQPWRPVRRRRAPGPPLPRGSVVSGCP